jgi:hypothetical protein
MIRLSAFLLVVAVALVSGCASVPMADPAADTAAKSFSPPPGKAGVYIFRNESMGAAVKMDVFLDGRKLGESAAKTYFYVPVDPGSHEVMGKAENESRVSFNAIAGRVYYFWQEVKMGVMLARNQLTQVDDAKGRAGVMESRLVSPAP